MSSAPAPLIRRAQSLLDARHLVEAGALRLPIEPTPAPARRHRSVPKGPRVMLVSEEPLFRLAMGRELASDFELVPTLGIASADRRMDLGVVPEAVIVDLDSVERAAVPTFLARLVERDLAGPRILVSSYFRPEVAAAYSASSLTHFALSRPWRPGALRTLVESVMGLSGLRAMTAGR
ncbi:MULTISPECIES: hypothetical protein [Myxococcus]|uniref:hypothetical protein n=1 Tax=Myxococcus TaxID=32 RepID=UPI0002EF7414|nr:MULTISPECIES: hypothetical protein [Myxococcus]UYI15102.1 hypothetical protein N3T43_02060 [Myxococcus xanthus]UYI22466.1 hypothetical protein N1129_02060 [Myxococcus xanthus]